MIISNLVYGKAQFTNFLKLSVDRPNMTHKLVALEFV